VAVEYYSSARWTDVECVVILAALLVLWFGLWGFFLSFNLPSFSKFKVVC